MRLALCGIAILPLLLAAASGCGDDDEEPSPSPSPSPTPAASPTAVSTPEPTGELTLEVDSVEPDTVNQGDTVTVTFATRPLAFIGLQVLDGEGNLITQKMIIAGGDGKAPFDFVAEGAPGEWMVSAAAGASLSDLLRLQASPVPGPNTVDRAIEVQ